MRKILTLMLAVVLILAIAACGSKEESKSESSFTIDELQSMLEEMESESSAKHENHIIISEDESSTSGSKSKDNSLSDIEDRAANEVDNTLELLQGEYEKLVDGVDSYETYLNKVDEIIKYYDYVNNLSAELCIKMCSYSVDYANAILSSDKSTRDMYSELEEIYESIYDDLGDDIYEGIYDGILEEMYDAFYDGALDEKPDDVEYKDWSNARSEEYEMWSDTRSETYEQWSDYRSDVYEFYSDLRSALYQGDIEEANEIIEEFVEDIEKLNSKINNLSNGEDTINTPKDETATGNENLVDGLRPEFKEAMDAYEAFYDEYCELLVEYSENPMDLTLLDKYTDMLNKASEMDEKFEAWDEDELNDAELKYYLDVNNRVMKKLLDAESEMLG